MNLRKELLHWLYSLMVNEKMCEELLQCNERLENYIMSVLPEGNTDLRADEGMGLMCELEHAAFCAGANMVLDFIAGGSHADKA